mmetsp:Transcript_11221/g.25195  ORF Transcript_11221/g.25195 Transcript_11221/m.25195 type:complete len:653 (-) Transcript_11221:103-2061(-)
MGCAPSTSNYKAPNPTDARRVMRVQCPDGGKPGNTIRTTADDGTVIEAKIPPNTKPGEIFSVGYMPSTQPMRSMQVRVPAGCSAGATVRAQTSSSETIEVKVPAGVKPGDTFTVQYRAASPPAAGQSAPPQPVAPPAKTEPHVPNRPARTPSAPMTKASSMRLISVMVPPGAGPGSTIQVMSDDGQKLQAKVPAGVKAGQIFQMQYAPVAKAPIPEESKLIEKSDMPSASIEAPKVQGAVAGTSEMWKMVKQQMDSALTRKNDGIISSLLDSAFADGLGKFAPESVKRAANDMAAKQLREAVESEDPKRLKGALLAAKRLDATNIPEFTQAAQKYRQVRKLPEGWDITKLAVSRKGDHMVAKTMLTAEQKMLFQKLLDLTHTAIYTRDRLGEGVPSRLELVDVMRIENDNVWSDYMIRRETIRQDLLSDPEGATQCAVATVANTEIDGDSAEAISMRLAQEFGEPLLRSVNEVFLYHGTNSAAADKIACDTFKLDLTGTNTGTLYGRGLYLAEHCTKSDEYTRPTSDGLRHILVCRTTLGRVYYTDEEKPDPKVCEEQCTRGKFNAILGDRQKCRGTFREFVLFDEEQVYPNYILTYRRFGQKLNPKRTIKVSCPADSGPGKVLTVQIPNGAQVRILVPPNTWPGESFLAQY